MGAGVTTVRVHLEVWMPFRGKTSWKGEEEVPQGITLRRLQERLGLTDPDVAGLVDGRYHAEDAPVPAGATVTFVHRHEGGAIHAGGS